MGCGIHLQKFLSELTNFVKNKNKAIYLQDITINVDNKICNIFKSVARRLFAHSRQLCALTQFECPQPLYRVLISVRSKTSKIFQGQSIFHSRIRILWAGISLFFSNDNKSQPACSRFLKEIQATVLVGKIFIKMLPFTLAVARPLTEMLFFFFFKCVHQIFFFFGFCFVLFIFPQGLLLKESDALIHVYLFLFNFFAWHDMLTFFSFCDFISKCSVESICSNNLIYSMAASTQTV